MGRAVQLVDPTSLAVNTTLYKSSKADSVDDGPESGQALILLGKWLECAPEYRIRSMLKRLCEEREVCGDLFKALTKKDCILAEKALLEAGDCPHYMPTWHKIKEIEQASEASEGSSDEDENGSDGEGGDIDLVTSTKAKAMVGAQTGGIPAKRKIVEVESDEEVGFDEGWITELDGKTRERKRVKLIFAAGHQDGVEEGEHDNVDSNWSSRMSRDISKP